MVWPRQPQNLGPVRRHDSNRVLQELYVYFIRVCLYVYFDYELAYVWHGPIPANKDRYGRLSLHVSREHRLAILATGDRRQERAPVRANCRGVQPIERAWMEQGHDNRKLGRQAQGCRRAGSWI